MKAYLIDPYQRKVHSLEVAHDLHAWHTLLQCDCLDVAHVGTLPNGRYVDCWVDDEGLLREPVPPMFKLGNYDLAGYGLVLECNPSDGESHGVSFDTRWFVGKLGFEEWERRLDKRDYFEQLSRIPSWETV